MHELSIALDICRIAEEKVGTGAVGNVVTIGLEVGPEAGVEIENLEFCLDVLLSQPPFRNAKAVIQRPPGDALRVAYLEVDDGDSDD
jgi:Zn finger protein HypA/HybF involved in hydrogenase expression